MRRTSVAVLTFCLILMMSVTAMAKKPTAFTVHGAVTTVELGHTTFTIHSKHHGTQTFTLAQKGVVEDANGHPVGFGALKVGEIVEVRYKPVGSNLEATVVKIQGKPKPH
jgi:hypothetical protein